VARGDRQLPEVGTLAPGFRLPRLEGGEISLAEIAAQGPALLAFFKISCPVCQLTFPFLERVHQAGTLPVYGISQNNAGDTRAFAERYRTTLPMLLDSEDSGFAVSNAYGISSVPTMFLIERDGSIAQTMPGWRKQEMAALGAIAGVSVIRPEDNVPEWKAG
jgi:peroxiredoxin